MTDAQRERAVRLLTRHVVAGSLTADELAARGAEAYAARTASALANATRDLPALPEPPFLTRLADRVPLRAHVSAYVLASVCLVAVWVGTREAGTGRADAGFGRFWPFWIMLAWGVLVGAHALYALRRPAFRPRRGSGDALDSERAG